MKIEHKSRPFSGVAESRSATGIRAASDGFAGVLKTVDRRLADGEIARLTARIEELGGRLVEAPSITLAEAYREAVSALVKKIVENGFTISNSSVQEARGAHKMYALVQEIDDRLLELLRTVLDGAHEPLHLLGLIGEIKGLLVSLRL